MQTGEGQENAVWPGYPTVVAVGVILLAAGRSTRFGEADKLAAPLGGVSLGLHAARVLKALSLPLTLVVTGSAELEWPGFEIVRNGQPGLGMSHSIALGMEAAERRGADAVLIALADMPFVTREHLERLLARHRGPASLIASSDGRRTMPPALFGADWFGALRCLEGDQGARPLLKHADLVVADPSQLRDIDRIADLEAAAALL